MAIQPQTGKGKPTIWRWQARFMTAGVDGVEMTLGRAAGRVDTLDRPGGGHSRRHQPSQRVQPHRVRRFKLSNDAEFAAKVQDIVGLCVNPPEHALVLSVDEKSQIQALDPHPAGAANETRPLRYDDPRL